MRKILMAAVGILASAATARAADPGPAWQFEPAVDPRWSETFYPVTAGAVVPRIPQPGETVEEAKALDEAWETGIRTYLRRVSHMVAGMNLPDANRLAHCSAMAGYVHDSFIHREGRRLGFARRDKAALMRACENRSFILRGFVAVRISAEVVSRDLVQVLTCYYHDQSNDPKVKEGLISPLRILPNGEYAVPRVSVETITRGTDGVMRIALHVALDSDNVLINEGCQGG